VNQILEAGNTVLEHKILGLEIPMPDLMRMQKYEYIQPVERIEF
jgi:hypothetical protein